MISFSVVCRLAVPLTRFITLSRLSLQYTRMKFGRRVQEESYEPYRPNYIAYKELKKAIKLITGSDTSSCTISEVTSSFGGITGFDEFTNRPPEAQFQNLLNFEAEKINKFSALTYANICSKFQDVLKRLVSSGETRQKDAIAQLKTEAEAVADEVVELHAYVRLNFIGFRKITKKYDKHSDTAASCWYLARILREKFMALDFDYLVELAAVCFAEIQSATASQENVVARPSVPAAVRTSTESSTCDGLLPEDKIDYAASAGASRGSSHSEPAVCAQKGVDEALGEMTHTTYFVGEDSIMRVRIHIAKHLPLVALGSSSFRPHSVVTPAEGTQSTIQSASKRDCPSPTGSRESVAGDLAPAAESSADTARLKDNLLRRLSTPSGVKLDEILGQPAQSVFYKHELDRSSASCLYFDHPGTFPKYNELLSSPSELAATCLRFRWATSNDPTLAGGDETSPRRKISYSSQPSMDSSGVVGSTQQPRAVSQMVVVELCPAFSLAASSHEWWHMPLPGQTTLLPTRLTVTKSVAESLINGTFDLESYIVSLTAAGVPASETSSIRNFLVCVLRILTEQNYVPMVQEWVHRTSFQKTSSTKDHPFTMYATLDENIRFVDAQQRKTYAQKSPGCRPSSCYWAPPHFANTSVDEDIRKSAFGILSISYSGTKRPDFLPRLTGLTSVTEVWRYSPLLHGVSTLYTEQLPSKARPEWFKLLVSSAVFSDEDKSPPAAWTSPKGDRQVERRRGKKLLDDSRIRVDIISTKPRDRVLHEHALHVQHQGLPSGHRTTILPRQGIAVAPLPPHIAPYSVPEGARQLTADPPHARHSGLAEPLLPLRGAVTPIQPLYSLNDDNHGLLPLWMRRLKRRIGLWIEWIKYLWCSRMDGWEEVGSTAVRVEPKTFFANERTLLQWLNTAVLLSTISITLLNFGSPSGRRAGLIMAPVALFFIGYAYWVYLRRSYSLERKKPINYNDRLGPAILVISLIGALSAIIILNIVGSSTSSPGLSSPTPLPSSSTL